MGVRVWWGREAETWPVSPQVLCDSPCWATVSIEMATKVGCTCLTVDLTIKRHFVC